QYGSRDDALKHQHQGLYAPPRLGDHAGVGSRPAVSHMFGFRAPTGSTRTQADSWTWTGLVASPYLRGQLGKRPSGMASRPRFPGTDSPWLSSREDRPLNLKPGGPVLCGLGSDRAKRLKRSHPRIAVEDRIDVLNDVGGYLEEAASVLNRDEGTF